MNRSNTKITGHKLLGILGAVLVFSGCLATETPSGPALPVDSEDRHVAMKLRMGMGSVNALGKPAVISLDKLVLVMTSSANDTIRDTITSSTSPALNTVATSGQTVSKAYTMQALRTWKIVATSTDTQDSVIHKDSATIPALYAGDTAEVSLNMSAKFVMYDAKFMSLPDSIASSTPGQPKQELCIDRLVFQVDSVTVRDSTVSPGPCFASLTTHTLSYDYIQLGTRNIRLIAYGPMNDWDVENPLYDGATDVIVGAGTDSTVALNLGWVGPTTGTGSIEVELGKVGKVTVEGTLPGTVTP